MSRPRCSACHEPAACLCPQPFCVTHAQIFYTAVVRIGAGLAVLNRAVPPGLTLWECPAVEGDADVPLPVEPPSVLMDRVPPALLVAPLNASTGEPYDFGGAETVRAYLRRIERDLLREALDRAHGNQSQAAKLVGAPYLMQFLRRLQSLGLKAPFGRPPES